MRKGGSIEKIRSDAETELRSAICIYLIAEHRDGATVADLARLRLGGRPALEEVSRVKKAVSDLVNQGEVKMQGDKVVPI
jgi:hypothetical protein